VDEAGRGCLAGPVVAAAVLLPDGADLPGLDDSKLLTPARREALDVAIRATTAAVGVGVVDAGRIDRVNILAATLEAMRQAVETALAGHGGPVGIVVVDGNQVIPGLSLPQRAWPKGDHLSRAVAAASIVAKVHRDRLMEAMDAEHPGYGFAVHKGYGTAAHLAAIRRLGPCAIHRMTFAPCRDQNASSTIEIAALPSCQVTSAAKKRTSR
jgi:ribonuclease HII